MSSSNLLPTLFVSDDERALSFCGKPPLSRAESYRFPAVPPALGQTGPALVRQVSSLQSVDGDTLDDLKFLLNSVVKIFVSSVAPNFSSPWTNKKPETSSGSGFILDLYRRMIVTNAHVATHGRTILIQREGCPDKFPALLLCISQQVDLAILTVPDDKFWDESAIAVVLGDAPRMQQSVEVIGYPTPGDSVCITQGVVSRVEYSHYSQSLEENQVVQVDAAINPGNSGGPAFSRGKLVGVAFQGIPSAVLDSVGFVIPVTVLRQLLKDFDDAATEKKLPTSEGLWTGATSTTNPLISLKGFARFTVETQAAESPFLRSSLKLPPEESGVVVREMSRVSNLKGKMLPNDVLVAVDGNKISNDGKVTIKGMQPISFESIVSMKLVGESVDYTVYRNGVKTHINIEAENPPRRAPYINKSNKISYVCFGGLVFSPLTTFDTARDFDRYAAACEAKLEGLGRSYAKVGQQIVFMSGLLPHNVNIGYETNVVQPCTEDRCLWKINDIEIDNVSDVARVLAEMTDEYVTFVFANHNVIVLPLAEGFTASWELQKDFGMPSIVSDDIATVIGETLAEKFKMPYVSKV